MNNREKNEGSNAYLAGAMETLTSLAEMDEHTITIAQPEEVERDATKAGERTILWMRHGDQKVPITEQSIKDIFRTILKYLRNFYHHERIHEQNAQSSEGIKTIMVLVGEAAKKLDKHTAIFHQIKGQSVTDLKEYKHLQEFYLSRIARKIDEGILGKWILGVSEALFEQKNKIKIREKEHVKEIEQIKHVFVDLDAVKKDSEYELFFISKEDGTHFYNPRLIRNMKLVCDFGSPSADAKESDPFEQIQLWDDNYCRIAATSLIQALGDLPQRFFLETAHTGTSELKESLSKAILALMISAKPQNQHHDPQLKGCKGYFSDFHYFLRQALHTREYQKLLAYPPSSTHSLLELTHALCFAFFSQLCGYQSLIPQIRSLIEKAHEGDLQNNQETSADKGIIEQLNEDYPLLNKFYRKHQYGPLKKILDDLEERVDNGFDPVLQHNLPNQLYALIFSDKKIVNVRTPTPTKQQYIHKPVLLDEFKGFLYHLNKKEEPSEKYLFINLQDKTSWKDYYRCLVLQELQKHPDFEKQFLIASLAKDTEFYHQQGPYSKENHTKIFLENFKENLSDENCGYSFPQEFQKELFLDFIDEAFTGIHKLFFAKKNVLTRERRLEFIEIFHLFLELKLIDLADPNYFSLACKDSLDVGAAANAQLFLFLKLLNEEAIEEGALECANFLLYAPALIVRERILQSERFYRIIHALKVVENTRKELGWLNFHKMISECFGLLYQTPILSAQASVK